MQYHINYWCLFLFFIQFYIAVFGFGWSFFVSPFIYIICISKIVLWYVLLSIWDSVMNAWSLFLFKNSFQCVYFSLAENNKRSFVYISDINHSEWLKINVICMLWVLFCKGLPVWFVSWQWENFESPINVFGPSSSSHSTSVTQDSFHNIVCINWSVLNIVIVVCL